MKKYKKERYGDRKDMGIFFNLMYGFMTDNRQECLR